MHINEGYVVGIMPIFPSGTNSTMFTACCQTAICPDEKNCPKCGRLVVGHDAKDENERRKIRWHHAYVRPR